MALSLSLCAHIRTSAMLLILFKKTKTFSTGVPFSSEITVIHFVKICQFFKAIKCVTCTNGIMV